MFAYDASNRNITKSEQASFFYINREDIATIRFDSTSIDQDSYDYDNPEVYTEVTICMKDGRSYVLNSGCKTFNQMKEFIETEILKK